MKNFISLFIFLLITLFIAIKLGNILIPKGWTDDFQGQIYSPKGFSKIPENQLDILFIGDSSIYKGVSPMQIYEKTGITSYNYNAPSARVYMSYYFLQNALLKQQPKVVFVDTVTMFYTRKEDEPIRRQSFDYMDLSKVKIDMINDDVFDNNFFDKISYILPIFRYHDRWQEINYDSIKESKKDYQSITKGFLLSTSIEPNKNGYNYLNGNEEYNEIKKYNLEYLYKIINLCKEKNIELVLLGLPDTKVWNQKSSDTIKKIADKEGVIFLDINDKKKYPINWNTDTEDGGGHMNIIGATRITNYIIDYLQSNYKLPDHRQDKNYSNWNKDLKIYQLKYEKAIKRIKKNADTINIKIELPL